MENLVCEFIPIIPKFDNNFYFNRKFGTVNS